MKRVVTIRLLPAVVFLFLVAAPLYAQETPSLTDNVGRWTHGLGEAWWLPDSMTKQDVQTLNEKWLEIERENQATTANEWTGTYAEGGDTHSSYLRWSVAHGYVMLHVDLCAAHVMALSYGKVVQSGSQIRLEPQQTFAASQYGSHRSHDAPARVFVSVKWRGVPYLIAQAEVSEFCDYVAGLGKYNEDSYWIESEPFLSKWLVRESGTPDDLPILPPLYQRFIRRPIEGNVAAVSKRFVRRAREWTKEYPSYESVTLVQINAGTSVGVKAGMRFYLLDSLWNDQLVIRRVGSRSSWGEVIRAADAAPGVRLADRKDLGNDESPAPSLVRGNRVTTSYVKYNAVVVAKQEKP
jgi:hypothetical protein